VVNMEVFCLCITFRSSGCEMEYRHLCIYSAVIGLLFNVAIAFSTILQPPSLLLSILLRSFPSLSFSSLVMTVAMA
jgi:hypothetical protein